MATSRYVGLERERRNRSIRGAGTKVGITALLMLRAEISANRKTVFLNWLFWSRHDFSTFGIIGTTRNLTRAFERAGVSHRAATAATMND